jgi:hypothetical protein
MKEKRCPESSFYPGADPIIIFLRKFTRTVFEFNSLGGMAVNVNGCETATLAKRVSKLNPK